MNEVVQEQEQLHDLLSSERLLDREDRVDERPDGPESFELDIPRLPTGVVNGYRLQDLAVTSVVGVQVPMSTPRGRDGWWDRYLRRVTLSCPCPFSTLGVPTRPNPESTLYGSRVQNWRDWWSNELEFCPWLSSRKVFPEVLLSSMNTTRTVVRTGTSHR